MSTVPIVIPFLNGTTQDVSDMDARRPGIAFSENALFTKTGAIGPRPGFTPSYIMNTRTLSMLTGTVGSSSAASTIAVDGLVGPDSSTHTFTDVGVGMFRYRDSLGERPGFTTQGRVWTLEDSVWQDRLFHGAATVDRLSEFNVLDVGTTALFTQPGSGFNYSAGVSGSTNAGEQGSSLLGSKPGVVAYSGAVGTKNATYGGSCEARVGSDVYHCFVSSEFAGNNLYLTTRKNNDTALTVYTLAANCEPVGATTSSIVPSCSTYYNAGALIWVCYRVSGGGSPRLLRVNPTNGTVLTAVTPAVRANVIGMWIHAQGASNRLICAFTIAATAGVVLTRNDLTTLAQTATLTYDAAAPKIATGPVVVGGKNSGPVVVEYQRRANPTADALVNTVVLGRYDPAGATADTLMTWEGWRATVSGTDPVANNQATLHYAIPFSPVVLCSEAYTDPGRIIIGLSFSTNGSIQRNTTPSTWVALDVTDMRASGEIRPGTRMAGIVATGPIQGTQIPYHPQSAIVDVVTFDTTHVGRDIPVSFRFASVNYLSFNSSGGVDKSYGLNRLTLITPDADSIGETTVLSGSVPHAISRGDCYELGFLPVAPEIWCSDAGIGTGVLDAGTYSVQALWKWVDEAGQIHRSAPSQNVFTVTIAGVANHGMLVEAQNLIVTQREFGSVFLEIYVTKVNPVAADQKFLQATVAQANGGTGGSIFTPVASTNNTIQVVDLTTLPLYTVNGLILQNIPVSADGGVATVNNRMWLSDGRQIYASKRYIVTSGISPQWNDEGNLTLSIPTPAGRVLALKGFNDKLLIFCERGTYWSQGDGPDDSGAGPGFLTPQLVSNLGVSNEKGAAWTSYGVAFHASSSGLAGTGTGGLYLVAGNMSAKRISGQVQDVLSNNNYTLAYVPESDLLVACNVHQDKAVVVDMRHEQYTQWVSPNSDSFNGALGSGFTSVTGAAGYLWCYCNADSDSGISALGSFSGATAEDFPSDGGVVPALVELRFKTNNIFANTSDGTGWSRVRSVAVLGDNNPTNDPTIEVTIMQDNNLLPQTGIVTIPTAIGTTWPVDRVSTELRLTNQKCSQVSIQLRCWQCTTLSLSALRLDVIPSRSAAPNNRRN